jgi:hypothetical protein
MLSASSVAFPLIQNQLPPDLLTIVLRVFVLQVAVDVPQTTADGQVGF